MCVDRPDITAQLQSRVQAGCRGDDDDGPCGAGAFYAEPGTINAGRQAYDRGACRFKSRAAVSSLGAPRGIHSLSSQNRCALSWEC